MPLYRVTIRRVDLEVRFVETADQVEAGCRALLQSEAGKESFEKTTTTREIVQVEKQDLRAPRRRPPKPPRAS